MAAPQSAHCSLVTACMNRDEHLKQVLPLWLKLPMITEIVVVDWSNATPLGGLCDLDPRVRVVRAEGEPRWILSYAFNLGVGRASGPIILKCDADCIPRREIVMNAPGASHFFAGFWQSGAKVNKASVNGQCIFSKAQFEAVNGYNEYIRTYGRDDEDFYDRLIAKGFQRREIPPAQLDFLDHTHEARMANQVRSEEKQTLETWLSKHTGYNEMRNYHIGKSLNWSPSFKQASYVTLEKKDRYEIVRRVQEDELALPPEVAQGSRLEALRYMAVKAASLSPEAASRLDEKACLGLLRIRTKLP